MTYDEMEILKPYKITKESSDKTFLLGEIIWISPNRDINSYTYKGWVEHEEIENGIIGDDSLDFECEMACEYEIIVTPGSECCMRIER